jgi:mannose-6-phosphate isomerase-like protein (cupin superfamily)
MEENIKYVLEIGGNIIHQTEQYIIKENKFSTNLNLKSYSIKTGNELEGRTFTDKDQVWYVILGKGDVQLNQQMYEVRPGSVITIPANVYHRLRNIGETDLYFICVVGESSKNVRP